MKNHKFFTASSTFAIVAAFAILCFASKNAVQISGKPEGAKIIIKDANSPKVVFEGKIPASVDLPTGDYTMSVSNPGYYNQNHVFKYTGNAILWEKYWQLPPIKLGKTFSVNLPKQTQEIDRYFKEGCDITCGDDESATAIEMELVDIEDDGVPEYMANLWCGGGSGEDCYFLFKKDGGQYKLLNEFSIYTACVVGGKKTNNVKNIECYSDSNKVKTFIWNGKDYGKTKQTN